GQRPFRCRHAPVWWARRDFASLTHFGQPLTDRVTAPFLVNRARAYARLWPRWVARSAIRAARARLG
ncbi:MAG: hypothetical protein NZ518_10535, partial [Dehalococcoidia bacterium]|nr:hypothetical protein [Dehalococcoidia bacterium]